MSIFDELYASHILTDEGSAPELVGIVPTPKHYKSEVFFKEDTPLDADKYRLRESDNFLVGRPPEKKASVSIRVNDENYWEARRKFIAKWNKLNPSNRISVK